MHLVDAFIQSDLQCIQAIICFFISMCVPCESNPQPFALLTQCSTTEPQEHRGANSSGVKKVTNYPPPPLIINNKSKESCFRFEIRLFCLPHLQIILLVLRKNSVGKIDLFFLKNI